MEIKPGKNRFYLLTETGKEVGEVTYSPAGDDKLIIDHTFVDDAFRGQDLAQQLVFHVVEFARKEGKKIIPLCPFAKSEFLKKAEYQDVEYQAK